MLFADRKRPRLNLALQGGGAHGAFTWGALERLLECDRIEPAWISGTSAGAVNAVAVAHGLASASGDAARELAAATLEHVWSAVERSGVPDLLSLNPFLISLARSTPITNLNGLFSPYSFNPLGFDPLRSILERHIDFDAIRANREVRVLVAATDVATGRARIFQVRTFPSKLFSLLHACRHCTMR